MYALVQSRLTEDGLLVSDVEASLSTALFPFLLCLRVLLYTCSLIAYGLTDCASTGVQQEHTSFMSLGAGVGAAAGGMGAFMLCAFGTGFQTWRTSHEIATARFKRLGLLSRSKCPGGIGPELGPCQSEGKLGAAQSTIPAPRRLFGRHAGCDEPNESNAFRLREGGEGS